MYGHEFLSNSLKLMIKELKTTTLLAFHLFIFFSLDYR